MIEMIVLHAEEQKNSYKIDLAMMTISSKGQKWTLNLKIF